MSTIKTTTLSTQGGSTVPVDTVVNGTAKAWVNFNGSGTVAIRRAFNVSSITDNGTGNYTITFTTAMVDADYGFSGVSGASANSGYVRISTNAIPTTSQLAIHTLAGNTYALIDTVQVSAVIFS
tara:strand:+ start:346 stop:717 length:372 start_codon:yes stop_codon:yes gene_type:complete